MNSLSVSQHRYPHQNEPAWSSSEKAIARKVFDAALERELQEVIREAKQKAGQIKESTDLWDLEHYLPQRRNEIESTTAGGMISVNERRRSKHRRNCLQPMRYSR